MKNGIGVQFMTLHNETLVRIVSLAQTVWEIKMGWKGRATAQAVSRRLPTAVA
jgi:hypothetical protein